MTEEQRARKRAYNARWQKDNPDKAAAISARFYENHRERLLAEAAVRYKPHPRDPALNITGLPRSDPGYEEAWRRFKGIAPRSNCIGIPRLDPAYHRAWRKVNPHKRAQARAKRKHGVRQATPTWADHDLIRDIYLESQYQGLQVDHIIPLKGRNVCGLHVEHNLQLLTEEDNRRKGNKLLPEHSNPICVFE